MAQIFGLWFGGSSYSNSGEFAENLEMFNSTDDAISACQSRMDSGHWSLQEFDYLNRDSEKVLTPCVDETAAMHVYFTDPTDSTDPYPDAIIEIDWDTETYQITPA